ncbi:hypothetical protein Desor_0427 [Desulfosporosinus orientis DSM 765]|uniref:Lipoprotein n=1 Tax=Desulfosporosinus orientis (strain ATCC 19365 / DSM 765 / NCIMB 8382 / VKM B-1628 / Singapore I) TaxID=768706 RepID=G7W7R6_DESOD|nr:hypothetical protein [Desulfosporosinus orientis]AET66131.1 hypothetical protein Desor_0427 [Desulfosporosinus orientis DSM 765]
MNKKIAIGICVIVLLFVTACGKSTGTSSGTQPQKSSAETLKSNADQVEETFNDFKGNQPAKMSGSSDNEFKLAMPEGGYKIVMKTKDLSKGLKGLDLVSASSNIGVPLFISASAGKSEEDWYVCERVEHMNSSDDTLFKVQASGPYVIEVYKLPLASGNVALPLSMNGKGTRALGPFTASTPLKIKLKTSDSKNAGFMVNLMDASSGKQSASVYTNIDMDTQKLINQTDVSKELTLTGSGSYFLMIEANGGCEWETVISN